MGEKSCFDEWKKDVFQCDFGYVEGLEEAVNELEDLFQCKLLCHMLKQVKATGWEKELLKRKVELESDQYKSDHALLKSLSSEEAEKAREKRRKIEKALEKLKIFHSNLVETAKQAENLKNAQDSNVQIEENSVKEKIQALETIATAGKKLVEDIKAKKRERSDMEDEFQNTDEIDAEIVALGKALKAKYKEFLRNKVDLDEFYRELGRLEEKTKKWQEADLRIKLSKTVIDFAAENTLWIVVDLVTQPDPPADPEKKDCTKTKDCAQTTGQTMAQQSKQ